jgi:phenylalanyl-tRNA synthetase beta chain
MRISLQDLRRYVAIEASVAEITRALTMAGLEVEEVEQPAAKLNKVVVGRVLSCVQHPNADKLSLCKVDVGRDEPTQIVCGAPNVAVGQTVPVALVGADLPNGIKIKKAKLRGEVSRGMICSQSELGLGEASDGIWAMELPDSVASGTDIASALQLEEELIFTIAVTANRPDCLSYIGIARELAAAFALPLQLPQTEVVENGRKIDDFAAVTVHCREENPRYAARLIDNVRLGPSPDWLQKSLRAAGMRPLNNIVDITNFVMLESGQPLHAFDFDQLAGGRIEVRLAEAGEKFTTLDSQERQLDAGAVLICDAQKPVALAGIMGGQNSEVGAKTKTILLESAYFSPGPIRRHAQALGLTSEASMRFARGTDPNGVVRALDRAAALLAKYASGDVLSGTIDVYPQPISKKTLPISRSKITQITGLDLSENAIADLLAPIDIQVAGGKATVPTYRPDLEREIDVVEEVARRYGFDNIPAAKTLYSTYTVPSNHEDEFSEALRNFLAARRLQEVVANSMVARKETFSDLLGVDPISILNPLSDDMACLRTDLLSSLIQVGRYNQNRQQIDLQLFEIGGVFYRDANGKTVEKQHLGIFLSGSVFTEQWGLPEIAVDFHYLRGLCEDILHWLGVAAGAIEFQPGQHPLLGHEQVVISVNKRKIGYLGAISPTVIRLGQLPGPAFYATFAISDLFANRQRLPQYQAISRFPFVRKDLALIVDKRIRAKELINFLREKAGTLLESVEIFDVFTGKHLQANEKSVAVRLQFRALDRTLREEEVTPLFETLIEAVQEQFDARLRGR